MAAAIVLGLARAVRDHTAAAAMALAAVLAASPGCSSSPSPTAPTTPTPTVDACGAVAALRASQPVVNGATCTGASSPVVLVRLSENGALVASCSGTVIASNAVLTAAHCVSGGGDQVTVWPGSGDLLAVTSYHAIPSYRPSDLSTPDAAVVLLSQPIGRRAVPLLTSRDATVGEQVVVAGWGTDLDAGTGWLRAGTMTVSAIQTLFVQASPDGTGANICRGDSGGPMLASQNGTWAIAGIASSGAQTCYSGAGNFVRVRNAEILSFILSFVPGAGQV